MAKISVCVASYKRPELLKGLLLSLIAQETEEFSLEIIVADNDAHRSAETVVSEFNANGKNVVYAVEPEQNISLARNKSLSLATGEYVATIDDDVRADGTWLLDLYRTLRLYNADVVFGPVIPVFPPQTPKYIEKSSAFNFPVPPTGSTGNFVPTAANSLFRRELIQNLATPFDPAFGRTGGGDSAFFDGLRRQGYKQVFCRDARVFEYISPGKANWRWIFQREFRIGNGYRRIFGREPFDSQLSRAGKTMVIGRKMAELCLIPVYVCGGLLDKQYAARTIERLRPCAFYAGFVFHLLGYRYEEYRGR